MKMTMRMYEVKKKQQTNRTRAREETQNEAFVQKEFDDYAKKKWHLKYWANSFMSSLKVCYNRNELSDIRE